MKIVKNRIDRHPFPFMVLIFDADLNNSMPVRIETWEDRESAMICGEERKNDGYRVNIVKVLAHTEG